MNRLLLIVAAATVALIMAIACNAVAWSCWPEPDTPLLNGCLAEGFTSDYTGRVEGYVLVTFPELENNGHKQFVLPERRARELQSKLTNALVDVKKLLEAKE